MCNNSKPLTVTFHIHFVWSLLRKQDVLGTERSLQNTNPVRPSVISNVVAPRRHQKASNCIYFYVIIQDETNPEVESECCVAVLNVAFAAFCALPGPLPPQHFLIAPEKNLRYIRCSKFIAPYFPI